MEKVKQQFYNALVVVNAAILAPVFLAGQLVKSQSLFCRKVVITVWSFRPKQDRVIDRILKVLNVLVLLPFFVVGHFLKFVYRVVLKVNYTLFIFTPTKRNDEEDQSWAEAFGQEEERDEYDEIEDEYDEAADEQKAAKETENESDEGDREGEPDEDPYRRASHEKN